MIRLIDEQERRMAESFLAETVQRLREMSERMSRARRRTAELREEIERHRAQMRFGPLEAVRDFRPITVPATPRRRRR
jgi:hypothetical protein